MRISAGITLATVVLVTIPTLGAAKEKTSLEEANRRWAGARCRSRIPISLKEEKPDDGWAKSMWIYRTPEGGNERVRVLLTRWDEIRGRYLGGTLPVGSEFIAVGWKTEKSKDRGKLYLELEHVELGAMARVYYGEDWVGLVEAKGLTEFEQWARLSMFEIVESPSEKLIAVAASAPVVPAGPAPTASVEAGALDIRLLGASTEPLTASPGRDIALVLTYEVTGLAPGAAVEVAETRTILRDDQVLATLEATVRQGAGVHRSTQPLTIPATVTPGVFRLEASVEAGGTRSSISTLFEVRRP